MKRISFTMRIDPADLAKLRALQKTTGCPVGEACRRAIKSYLAAGAGTRQIAGLLHGNASIADEARKVQRRRRS